MNRLTLVLTLAAATALPMTACRAQETAPMTASPTSVEALDRTFGLWTLTDGADATCRLSLSKVETPLGHQVVAEGCKSGPAAGVRAWRPVADGVALLDGQGATILTFTLDGPDRMVSADGALRLARTAMR